MALSALVYVLLDGVVTIEGNFHLGSWNLTGKAASVSLRAYTDADGVMRAGPVALITTLIFGLGHGFNMDHLTMNFAWLPFAYATIFGGWLAFLRLRTRGLAALIVSHNVSNVCTLLVNGLP